MSHTSKYAPFAAHLAASRNSNESQALLATTLTAGDIAMARLMLSYCTGTSDEITAALSASPFSIEFTQWIENHGAERAADIVRLIETHQRAAPK